MFGKRHRNNPEYAESPEAFQNSLGQPPKEEKNAKNTCFSLLFSPLHRGYEAPGGPGGCPRKGPKKLQDTLEAFANTLRSRGEPLGRGSTE